MFGPSSLVCDNWPSSLCGVGEVEPSLRPLDQIEMWSLCYVGLGLPITESWRNRYLCPQCVLDKRVATRNVGLAGVAAEASASVELYTRANLLSAYCTAGAAVQCTCYNTGDLFTDILL